MATRRPNKASAGQDSQHEGARGMLAPEGMPTIGDLERALFACFPRESAEGWDRCGLLVGDPSEAIGTVAIALDADSANVRAAHEAGANVLLTHHPAFLDPPGRIGPHDRAVPDAGTTIWEAARLGVALVNFHTCLDRASIAQRRLPELLGLAYLHPLEGWSAAREAGGPEATPDPGIPAYGAVCRADPGLTLDGLADRCEKALGGLPPRVWGDGSAPLATVATCTGSAGSLADELLAAGIDCMVAGELRYHAALDIKARGLCVIELGHDVSEQPLCECLRQALVSAGLPRERIAMLQPERHWHI